MAIPDSSDENLIRDNLYLTILVREIKLKSICTRSLSVYERKQHC